MSETDVFVGMHYVLAGYIKRGAVVPPPKAWVKSDGSVTPQSFTIIVHHRPNDCRFAVAQALRLRQVKSSDPNTPLYCHDGAPSGPFLVWDLFDDQLVRGMRTGPSGIVAPPPPMWMVPNEDGALMKALSFYDYHP